MYNKVEFSGFENVVSILKNIHGGELAIIGSIPSLGKTWLALEIIKDMVINNKISACIFSLEISKEKLLERFSKIDFAMNSNLVEIIDNPTLEIEELKSIIENKKNESGIKLFFIDYLSLLWNDSKENMEKLIGILKSISVELDVTIIGLTMLSREFAGIKPEIKYFNIPKNNVNLIIGLHKEMNSDKNNKTEILILKNDIK